jgi:hypothetical protein
MFDLASLNPFEMTEEQVESLAVRIQSDPKLFEKIKILAINYFPRSRIDIDCRGFFWTHLKYFKGLEVLYFDYQGPFCEEDILLDVVCFNLYDEERKSNAAIRKPHIIRRMCYGQGI